MFCSKCGAELRDGSKFCPKCGAQLSNSADKRGKTTPRVASSRKLPIKLLVLLGVGVIVAIIATVIVPLMGEVLGQSNMSLEQPSNLSNTEGAELESEPEDKVESGATQEGVTLELTDGSDFDYDMIEIGSVQRTDFPGRKQTSVFEWTVTNKSDMPCPAVALGISYDYSKYEHTVFRDAELETTHVDFPGGGFAGGIQGFGVLYDTPYSSAGRFGDDSYAYVCALKPGEARTVYLYLNYPLDSALNNIPEPMWADEEKSVYTYDNLRVEKSVQASHDFAKQFKTIKESLRILPEEWDVTDPKVTAEGENDRLQFTFTNTTDYRIDSADILYAPVDSDGRLWPWLSIRVGNNLEPGETVTAECTVERNLDETNVAKGYKALSIDVDYE